MKDYLKVQVENMIRYIEEFSVSRADQDKHLKWVVSLFEERRRDLRGDLQKKFK